MCLIIFNLKIIFLLSVENWRNIARQFLKFEESISSDRYCCTKSEYILIYYVALFDVKYGNRCHKMHEGIIELISIGISFKFLLTINI